MPDPETFRGLYIGDDRTAVLKTVPLPPLGEDQVRVRTEFASIKHGTEFYNLSGHSPFDTQRYDGDLQLFVPLDEAESAKPFAGGFVGNTAVGTVIEAGGAVTAFRTGDWVYGYGPACELLTGKEDQFHPLTAPLTEADAVCIDPAFIAYAAVRDAHVCLGDNVIVFGLGAIGLFTVQMLKQAGCLHIIAVDLFDRRRTLAETFGADLTLDPARCDVAMEVRRFLGHGADIAIEASGSYKALREAIRSVRKCARILTLGFYHGKDTDLHLDKEWFHNRLEMICSLPDWGNPLRDYPLWTRERVGEAVTEMFRRKTLISDGILDPIVDFADAAHAFREIFENPLQAIKLGIRFPH